MFFLQFCSAILQFCSPLIRVHLIHYTIVNDKGYASSFCRSFVNNSCLGWLLDMSELHSSSFCTHFLSGDYSVNNHAGLLQSMTALLGYFDLSLLDNGVWWSILIAAFCSMCLPSKHALDSSCQVSHVWRQILCYSCSQHFLKQMDIFTKF